MEKPWDRRYSRALRKAQRMADKLNRKLPKSEVWFHELYKNYRDVNDVNNKPVRTRVADLLNTRYNYIIEIDGHNHFTPKQKLIDKKKDKLYRDCGFELIRIEAYNLQSFEEGLNRVLQIRAEKDNLLFNPIKIDYQKIPDQAPHNSARKTTVNVKKKFINKRIMAMKEELGEEAYQEAFIRNDEKSRYKWGLKIGPPVAE